VIEKIKELYKVEDEAKAQGLDAAARLALRQTKSIPLMRELKELEATDWYEQRIAAASDPELKKILAHNRDEEKEHAAMVLEWLPRQDPVWDKELREYLFTSGPISAHEEEATGVSAPADAADGSDGSLGIGSLREVTR
jgi:ferritin-like protein